MDGHIHNQILAKPNTHVQAMCLIKSRKPNQWKEKYKEKERKSEMRITLMRITLEPTLFERH